MIERLFMVLLELNFFISPPLNRMYMYIIYVELNKISDGTFVIECHAMDFQFPGAIRYLVLTI